MIVTRVVWSQDIPFIDDDIGYVVSVKRKEMIRQGKTDGTCTITGNCVCRIWRDIESAQEWIGFCRPYALSCEIES